MRFRDLVGLALFALSRHKVRTVLTMLGVLFSTLILAACVALFFGVRDTVVRQASKVVDLRRIEVYPKYEQEPIAKPIEGRMSDERRERLRLDMRWRWGQRNLPPAESRLTPARVAELAQLDHVARIEPVVQQYGRVVLGDRREDCRFLAAPNAARANLSKRLLAGSMLPPRDPNGVLVSEWLLYRLGVVDEADVERAIGRTLQFEVRLGNRLQPTLLLRLLTGSFDRVSAGEEDLLGKVLKQLPGSLDRLDLKPPEKEKLRLLLQRTTGSKKQEKREVIQASYTIRGVLGPPRPEEMRRRDGPMWAGIDLVLAPNAAEEFFLRLPGAREEGFGQAIVEVDDMDNVKEVQQRIHDMGFEAASAVEHIEREQFIYSLVCAAMGAVALIAMLVAAIGIANIMLMSVLERTREIGVMKALGARDGQVQALFLMEGALLGLVGGLLGLVGAWGVSFPTNGWLKLQVAQWRSIQLDGSLFAFPSWLIVAAPAFAVLVTVLAALYPARRAIRIDPVQALRHE